MARRAVAARLELPDFIRHIAFERRRSYIWFEDGTQAIMTIDDIRDNFALLEDWDDRYRYVIELGRTLEAMPEAERSPENKVRGCVSQAWQELGNGANATGEGVLHYRGDSDSHSVRGLIAIALGSIRTTLFAKSCLPTPRRSSANWVLSNISRRDGSTRCGR